MKLAVISHPECALHEMGKDHPEGPNRIIKIDSTLRNSTLAQNLDFIEAHFVEGKDLNRAHANDYISCLAEQNPVESYITLDNGDTLMNPHTYVAASLAAGAVTMAVNKIIAHENDRVFCNIRPPGHHALKAQANGFCFFNNVAIGALKALESPNIKRVAIIDFDAHHCNGTEDIFANNPNVMVFSSYRKGIFPMPDVNKAPNNIHHLPLNAGCSGKKVIEALQNDWAKQLDKFKPDLIFISAGFDAHIKDPMRLLKFSNDDYIQITKLICELANKYCNGKIISVLEGGYSLDVLSDCVEAHIGGLIEHDYKKKITDKMDNILAPSPPQTPHYNTRSRTKALLAQTQNMTITNKVALPKH